MPFDPHAILSQMKIEKLRRPELQTSGQQVTNCIMKRLFTIIFLALTFYACVMDRVYNCKIKNDSIDKIQIKISFDKNFIDSIYNGNETKFLSFVKENIGQDSGVSMINLDTLNLTVIYQALPKTSFTLEHGMSGPDYSFYKAITVFDHEKIELNGKKEIDNAFKKIDGEYLLTIE